MSDTDFRHGTDPVPCGQPASTVVSLLPEAVGGAGRMRRRTGAPYPVPMLAPGPAGPLPYACDAVQLAGFEGAAP
jgi:hypothetical protein